MNTTTLKDNLITQFRNKMAHLFVVLKDLMYNKKEINDRSSIIPYYFLPILSYESFRAGNLIVTFRMINLCFNNFDRNIGGDAL